MANKQEFSTTSFGRYLRTMRLSRGFDNINDYARHYQLPITAGYYRDIENGRRILNISSAEQICLALKADLHEFIYHFLEGMVPEPVFKQLKAPNSSLNKSSGKKNAGFVKDKQTAFLASQIAFLDDEIAKVLETDIKLLDLLSFIYLNSPQGITRDQLEKFIIGRYAQLSSDEIVALFTHHGLVQTLNDSSGKIRIIATKQSINWTSHRKVSRLWKLHRLKTAIERKYSTNKLLSNSTSVKYGIAQIRKSQVSKMIQKLAAYEQTVLNAPTNISKENQTHFLSLAIIFRPEYR